MKAVFLLHFFTILTFIFTGGEPLLAKVPASPVAVQHKIQLSALKISNQHLSADNTSTQKDIDTIVEEFTEADAFTEETKILDIYQELFQLSYASAPEIRIARSQTRQKSKERYTAWAKRFSPAVNASLSQVHEFYTEDETTTDTDTASYKDGEDYPDWGLNLDLPIYRRALSVQLKAAIAEELLAENNLLIKTQELDLNLRELLGTYIESCYRLFNIENSVQLSRDHVDKIYKGYQLRDQTRLQLLRAQANLKELEARLDLDEENRDAAFRELLNFTALPASNPALTKLNSLLADEVKTAGSINSLADLDASYPRIQPYIEELDKQALYRYFEKNSLIYRNILLEKELSDHKANTYTQDEWPELAVRGLIDRRDDTEFSNFDSEGSVALVLSIPLFSGGTLFSNMESQAQAKKIAKVTEEADLRASIHTLENIKKQITSLKKVYTTQQINLRQQQEIVTLSLKSYSIKQTSMQDLLTSQNKLIDAKNALMQTTNRLGSLYRQFAWQLGTPYSAPQVTEVL